MFDYKWMMSDNQALAISAAANAVSTKRIALRSVAEDHLGNAGVTDIGDVEPDVVVVVTTALVAAVTGAILTCTLYEHTLDATITDGNAIPTASEATTAIDDAGANFPAGTEIMRKKIRIGDIDEAFIGLNYAVTVQDLASGAVLAYIDFGSLGYEKL